jgi:hypothetical protein
MINLYTSGNSITDNKSINISHSDPGKDNEWIEYISSHPDALIYHHPLWLNVLEAETGNKIIRLTAKDESGKITGVLPLQVTSGMFFGLGGLAGSPRVSSLPRTPLTGILADNNEAAGALLSEAINITNKYSGTKLQIKTLNKDFYSHKNIKIIPWRENFTIKLPENEEDIKFGSPRNHRRIKWAVNKAQNEGVKIRKADSPADLKKWYDLYLDTSRWHAVPPRSYKFFDTLFNTMNDNQAYLLLAEKDNNILAGSVFLMFNKTVFYSFNGRDKNQLQFRPNDLIQFEAIYRACRDGYSFYDMGEVSGGQDGLVEFKKKWGCDSRQIYHVYYSPGEAIKEEELISDAPGNLRLNIWRKIPVGITAKLGELINHRL